MITNAALLTYVIPGSFLAIPFYLIMNRYGMQNNPWSVIAVLVTFTTPYAIFIFQEYGRSIPLELDSRRGSTAPRRFRSISASTCR
jgi:multiple sugar transport system permease protein